MISLPNRSTPLDRLLLFGFIVLIPLQSYFPTYKGLSITFLFMALVATYFFIFRPVNLIKSILHPVSLSGLIFAGTSLVMEFLHDSHSYKTGIGIALMILGGVLVAGLCRDRKALQFGLYGFVVASCIVSLVLMLTVFGKLSTINAENAEEASRARVSVYSEKPLGNDINQLAFHAGQGVVAVLILGLTAKTISRKLLFLGVGAFMVVGTLLPMSRGGLAILVISCGSVAYFYGLMKPKMLLLLGTTFLIALLVVPGAVLSRLDLTDKGNLEKSDSRVALFVAVMDHVHEFWLFGIGENDFWGKWGKSSGFYNPNHGVVGAHNYYLQTMILWGMPGLLTLLALVWNAFRFFPRNVKSDPLKLFILGISISVLLESLVVHVFAGKEFSVVLGLIIGSALWIWPKKRKISISKPKGKFQKSHA